MYNIYLSKTMFSFPRHLLTTIFCISTLIIYPLVLFKNKINKLIGVLISIIIIIVMTFICFLKPQIYSTEILMNGDNYQFDDSYKVYLTDNSYGDLKIIYMDSIDTWMVHADFKKSGNTEFILESPSGNKKTFNITIKEHTYKVEERN